MTLQIYVMIIISFIGILRFICIKFNSLRIFKGNIFDDLAKIYLFVSDTKYYVQVKLTSLAENVHSFAAQGQILAENVTLRRNCGMY